jgi:hypothetical protein
MCKNRSIDGWYVQFFYEPKEINILHFDNASKEKPMTFIAFYLKEDNEANIQIVH